MQNSLTKQLYGGIMKMKKEMDIMLLEFSCSNYKSIMNKVTFSFLASKDDTYEDELKSFSNFKVLRSAVIYGPNGSGKSNFLNAIEFMQGLILNSINYQPGDDISQYAHKLSGDETPSIFSMQFIKMISDMPMDSHYEIGQLTKNIYIISLRIDKLKFLKEKELALNLAINTNPHLN